MCCSVCLSCFSRPTPTRHVSHNKPFSAEFQPQICSLTDKCFVLGVFSRSFSNLARAVTCLICIQSLSTWATRGKKRLMWTRINTFKWPMMSSCLTGSTPGCHPGQLEHSVLGLSTFLTRSSHPRCSPVNTPSLCDGQACEGGRFSTMITMLSGPEVFMTLTFSNHPPKSA